MEKVSRILIADDESDILVSYKEALERANHKVTTTKDGRNALRHTIKNTKNYNQKLVI